MKRGCKTNTAVLLLRLRTGWRWGLALRGISAIGNKFRSKFKMAALTMISYHDVAFTFDATFLADVMTEAKVCPRPPSPPHPFSPPCPSLPLLARALGRRRRPFA